MDITSTRRFPLIYLILCRCGRSKLTNVIRAAATINDTDIDGLPDAWEQSTVGSIDAAADTPLPSGNPALLAYALSLGTDHPQPHLAPATGFVGLGDETHQTVTFRRRLGLEAERLVYQPEKSTDGGRTWSTSAGDWVEHETREPLHGSASGAAAAGGGSAGAGLAAARW